MIRSGRLFEAHLTVSDLGRAMSFYGGTLGLELAFLSHERGVAFYWLGGRGKSMLGLWAVGGPVHLSLHTAFEAELDDVLNAVHELRKTDVMPLDFAGNPTDEPVVLAWMPAASLYFRDPDGNLLELLAMLNEEPAPELGVMSWSDWIRRKAAA